MATQTLEAIYENGVFRPINGLPFAVTEGQHAHIVVEVEEKTEAPNKPRIAGLHAGLVGWDPTFDDELPDSFWMGEE